MLDTAIRLVPLAIALVLGALAVIATEYPRKTEKAKRRYVAAVVALSVLAIGATAYSQLVGEAKEAAEQARVASIREALGAYMSFGQGLMDYCADNEKPLNRGVAEWWGDAVREYLRDNLGRSYVTRFDSNAGLLPLVNNSIKSEYHRNVCSWLNKRLARLEQFSQEFSR